MLFQKRHLHFHYRRRVEGGDTFSIWHRLGGIWHRSGQPQELQDMKSKSKIKTEQKNEHPKKKSAPQQSMQRDSGYEPPKKTS